MNTTSSSTASSSRKAIFFKAEKQKTDSRFGLSGEPGNPLTADTALDRLRGEPATNAPVDTEPQTEFTPSLISGEISQEAKGEGSARLDDSTARGHWLKESKAFIDKPKPVDNVSEIVVLAQDIKGANAALDDIDTQNPSLVADGVSASWTDSRHGLLGGTAHPSAVYLDLGGNRQVLITSEDGRQQAYIVENGKVTQRLKPGEFVDLGNGRRVAQPEGEGLVRFSGSCLPPGTVTSGLKYLTLETIESVGPFIRPGTQTYEIGSGQQVATNGVPDLENMTTQQQFDFYSNKPEGKNILAIEGDYYGNVEAKQALFVARVRKVARSFLIDSPPVELRCRMLTRPATMLRSVM